MVAIMDSLKEDKLKKLYLVYESRVDVVDPYQIPEEQWKDNISLWPPLEYGDI